MKRWLWFVLLLLAATGYSADKTFQGANGITLPAPPPTASKPVTDDLHGTKLTDPYRWLEDRQSPETSAWIDAQMQYTQKYLSQVKFRPAMTEELGKLVRVETYTVPVESHGNFFFMKRLADENQASIYVRRGLHAQDERLIDATKLSADQNTSIEIDDVSRDGKMLVYGVRSGGADEEGVHVRDVDSNRDLDDSLPSARYFGVQLAPDGKGLYYSLAKPEETLIYYHAFGSPAGSDKMIFGKSFEGETFGAMQLIGISITDNQRYLILAIDHGVPAKRQDIYVKDLRQAEAPIRPLIRGIDNRFTPINSGDDFFVMTDYQAPNYRVLKVDPSHPKPEDWKTIVPEGKDVISEINVVGGKLFVTSLHDVVTQTRVFSLDGKQTGEVTYATMGAATTVNGREDSQNGFYSFESFIFPRTIYHYDVQTGRAEVFARPSVPFDSNQYEVKQVFYKSKDGTRVPMFISSKKGTKLDGSAPALMGAYGGFLSNETPVWSSGRAWWMEHGGIYVQPNLRGGGEYGEKWHQAGMFERKQNVFDDFYAAAQYLFDNHYTTPQHLAIAGASNGGLLMGAAMTQHPEMFGAIYCGYPLLDMIRFQNFLIGKWWTSEYGSSDDPKQFPYLLKYSPYHNVHPGTKFPAILFNTGDSDTRVDPLHARKMTALVQADNGGDRPVMLNYQKVSGHSAGVSVTQAIQDAVDEYSFLWNEVGGH